MGRFLSPYFTLFGYYSLNGPDAIRESPLYCRVESRGQSSKVAAAPLVEKVTPRAITARRDAVGHDDGHRAEVRARARVEHADSIAPKVSAALPFRRGDLTFQDPCPGFPRIRDPPALVCFLPRARRRSHPSSVIRHPSRGRPPMRVRILVTIGFMLLGAAATASAQAWPPCVKPWAIPDKWLDLHDDPDDGEWNSEDTFETHVDHFTPMENPDFYADNSFDPSIGTGFKLPRDLGLRLTLKLGTPKDVTRKGWFYAVELPGAGGGGSNYRTMIATCQPIPPMHVGDSLNPLGGDVKGPTVQGTNDLINLDPTAEWDPVSKTVIKSCAPSPECGPISPRIVAILAVSPVTLEWSVLNGGLPALQVTNIIAVFIDGVVGGKVTGYITTYPW
jgi:hypothetical protein